MPLINNRIKGSCQVAIAWTGIAVMTFAAPINASPPSPTPEGPAEEPGAGMQPVAPDNSKKNKRDLAKKNPTPMDQGGSAQDIKITREIRKSINQMTGVSTNGKNVKIITVDSMVTLRGPVASLEEKQLIYDVACKTAGPAKVKNQLEVK